MGGNWLNIDGRVTKALVALVLALGLCVVSTVPVHGLSNAADILTYSLSGQAGAINSGAATIGVTVPFGTNVTGLVATFATSANITSIKVGADNQTSGATANNFTNPVIYVVTAQDGTTSKSWTVTVTVGPVSTDANLSNLTISSGTLTPAFAAITTTYTDSVANGVTAVTVTPTVNESHATVTVNGVVVASGSSSGAITLNVGSNAISIVATAQDGITTKTYSIAVTRAGSNAAEITAYSLSGQAGAINSGAATIGVTVPFGTNVTGLVATFATSANITSIKVGADNQTSGATANNFTNPVIYVVTAQDGTTSKSWTVTVTVGPVSTDANLSNLTISSGTLTPAFAAITTTYTDSVANGVTAVTVTPTVNESHATVTVNGVVVASGSSSGAITLNVGSNAISIVVTAQDGITTKTYSIAVTRAGSNAAEITAYSLSGQAGAINSGAATIGVTVPFGTNVTGLVATFATSANITSIKVGADNQTSGATANNFTNPVIYVVTAQDGTTSKSWTVTVTVGPVSTDANLSNLTISSGTLTPAFAAITTTYTDSVANGVTAVTVTPTVNESHATVTVNGVVVASGSSSGAITLNVGSNAISIVATAQDGITTKTYSIAVTRAGSNAAEITAYSLSGQAGAINSGAATIGVTVPFGTNVTGLVATFATSANITSIKVGADNQTSGATANNFTNPVIYVVTAQDGTTSKSWTVTVTVGPVSTDANLSNLTISSGTLTPAFAAITTTYTDSVANGVTAVTVTPTVNESHATVTVNGVVVASGSSSGAITLNVGSNAISIVVTAQDGITTKTYSIAVTRLDSNPSSGGGGGGFGGGGGGGPTGPGITNLVPYTNSDGLFSLAATAASDDGKVKLSFVRGVLAKAKDGSALRSVSIQPLADPPAPPADTRIIGLAYELEPAGATFNPAITLTLSYDPARLPAGVEEKNLVLATWDAVAGKWVELQATVDTTAHTLSVTISHFSSFAVMAHTRAASFSIGDLSISPAEVPGGGQVKIAATVRNSGDLGGTYSVELKVNGQLEATQSVTVGGNAAQSVSFSVVREAPGSYEVTVGGLSGSFKVVTSASPALFRLKSLSINPGIVNVGQDVTVSVIVENTGDTAGSNSIVLKVDGVLVETREVLLGPKSSQKVDFICSGSPPGVRKVNVSGLDGAFTVRPLVQPRESSKINWWLLGGVIAAIVLAATIFSLTVKRRVA